MLALCQHNTLAYYAFYYAGIFEAGLGMVSGIQFHYQNTLAEEWSQNWDTVSM